MASVAAFVFVQRCTARGLEDSSIWNGFLRDVTRRRPPVQRAAFRGTLPWSTRRSAKGHICPIRCCLQAVYRRGERKVESFAFAVQANALDRVAVSAGPQGGRGFTCEREARGWQAWRASGWLRGSRRSA